MKIKLIKFKNVKSTNDIAFKLIRQNFYEPTLITTEKQTSGRGRIGKKWISKKGNLFITIFFKIKWPNDLLFEKQKFCGILQEVIKFNDLSYLIVGIGLNTNIAPRNKSFQSTCLKNIINSKISNPKVLKDITLEYEKFLNQTKKMSFPELKRKYK